MRSVAGIKNTGQTIKRTEYGNGKSLGKTEHTRTLEKIKRDEAVFTDRVVREEEKLKQLFETLKKEYPQIHFKTEQTGTDPERNIISDALDEMGEGYVLFLSDEFLASGGRESYEKKERMLLECVKRLAVYRVPAGVFLEEDRAVFWQSEEKAEGDFAYKEAVQTEAESGSTLPSPSERQWSKSGISASSSYNIAAAYARLAGAKTRSAVQTVMQQARRDITSLKFLSLYGDEKERRKARAAIQSLQKLLLRGSGKLKSFAEEQLTAARKKKMTEQGERKKEIQALLELKRRKTARYSRDGAIRVEGRLEKLNVPGYYDREKQRMYLSPSMKRAAFEEGIPNFGTGGSQTGESPETRDPAEGFAVTEVVYFH